MPWKNFGQLLIKKKRKAIGVVYKVLQVINNLCGLYTRGFKALKQMTKLLFLALHRPNDALKTYVELLTYTKTAVTRNYSEKSINGILDYVGGGKGCAVEVDILEKFYQATRKALEDAKNEVGRLYLLDINY